MKSRLPRYLSDHGRQVVIKTLLKILLSLCLLIAALCVPSCQKESGNPVDPNQPPPTSGDKISIGQTVDLGGQTIGTSGGTFTINKPGDPLNGFQITVPKDGFTVPQTFAVSYAPITSHQLGSAINPIAPLIKISSDGGYSTTAIKVKVPIKLPADGFAMGFFYDEATGSLEPLPVTTLDSTSIEIAARHLSPSNARLGKGLLKGKGLIWGNILVSYIVRSTLRNLPVLTTAFTPGVDDWEFPNYGSYIAPGGHCAGQTATAVWYFYEHKLKGDPALFGRYDKLPGFWPDNTRGYKFASTIQADMKFAEDILSVTSWSFPSLAYDAFVYSMYVTGKPQMVGMYNSKGAGGHEMICYKIDVFAGKLYVADPNYPGDKTRVIEYIPGYTTGGFKPYSSALKAGDDGVEFDKILYDAVTSMVEWSKISQRWTEFQNGTIGSDRFPAYSLTEIQSGRAFTEGFETDLDSARVVSVVTGCPFALPGTTDRQYIEAYDTLGTFLDTTKVAGVLTLGLKPGDNTYCLLLRGQKIQNRNSFVDYIRMKVRRRMSLTIATTESNGAPVQASGTKSKLYTFVAKSAKPVPRDGKVKYEWNFGDGTSVATVNNDSTIAHTFAQDGTYTVGVSFYYDAVKISSVSAQAVISPVPAPMITGIVPSSGKAGDTVRVVGSNFGLDKTKGTVTFASGVTGSQVVSWNNTEIRVVVPQGAQSGSVTVTVNALVSNAVTFTVVIAPVISSVTPNAAMVRDTISIDGNNFGTDRTNGTVYFTGGLVSGVGTVSWTNTRIRLAVPLGAVTGPVFVNVAGVESNRVNFTVNLTPSISTVTPTQVSYAMPIRISGKGFGGIQGTSGILFGTYPAKSVVSWTDNEIVATVPELFTSGVITLTINGNSYRSQSLNCNPQIASTSPDSAMALEVIKIKGTLFGYEQGHSKVIFSYVDTAKVLSWSNTEISVVVPDPSSHRYGADYIKIVFGNGIERNYNKFFVIEDVLETLHRTQAVGSIVLGGMMTTYYNPPERNETKASTLSMTSTWQTARLTWSGTSFHGSWTYTTSTDTTTKTYDGTVSGDGKTLLTITARNTVTTAYSAGVGYGYTETTEIVYQNVPMSWSTPENNSVGFGVTGIAARDKVVSVKYERRRQGIVIIKYIGMDWANTASPPGITVRFD